MIEEKDFDYLIADFSVGTSTAEKDPLLPAAQIRTQEFHDLYFKDRIDLIRGIKGAGKTALYRVFFLLREELKTEKLFCIFGVEATGDPVFSQFRSEFSTFSAIEFENFWLIYFLSLIREELYTNLTIKEIINGDELVSKLEKLWKKKEIPLGNEGLGLYGTIKNILSQFTHIRKIEPNLEVKSKPNGSVAYKPGIDVELETEQEISTKPKYVGDILNLLKTLLSKYKIRIWLLLDRLDEVFPRRTGEEENGLKGLLKAAYNITCPELRIKIFLRDDIIEQLANSTNGFTALTHVTDRASPTMIWSKDNILLLIIKRIFTNSFLANFYKVDSDKIEKDAEYRKELFYNVFPPKVGKYATLDWLLSVCADGNDICTPRDIIDLINFAKAVEYKDFQVKKGDRDHLINENSLKKAFEQLSIEKKNKYLLAEFPHMKSHIIKLEGGYSIHNQSSLEELYQDDWKIIASNFVSIGLFKHDPKKGWYKIPRIWMKGLKITQGKAFGHKVNHPIF